jgi:hypothetical protein
LLQYPGPPQLAINGKLATLYADDTARNNTIYTTDELYGTMPNESPYDMVYNAVANSGNQIQFLPEGWADDARMADGQTVIFGLSGWYASK